MKKILFYMEIWSKVKITRNESVYNSKWANFSGTPNISPQLLFIDIMEQYNTPRSNQELKLRLVINYMNADARKVGPEVKPIPNRSLHAKSTAMKSPGLIPAFNVVT